MEESRKTGQKNMRFLFLGKYHSAVREPRKDAASSHVTCLEECRLTWHRWLEKCLWSSLVVKEYGEISGLEKNINCVLWSWLVSFFFFPQWADCKSCLYTVYFFVESTWMEVRIDTRNVRLQSLCKLNLVFSAAHLSDTPFLQVKTSWSELCPAQHCQFWTILTRRLLLVLRPRLCSARNRKRWKAETLFGVGSVSRCAGN